MIFPSEFLVHLALNYRWLVLWLLCGVLGIAGCQAVDLQAAQTDPITASTVPQPPLRSEGTITLNPQVAFQTMVGWEAVAQAGQLDSPAFSSYRGTLFDLAVNDLGINRLRVEVKNPPGSTAFDLSALDSQIDSIVVPIQQRLAARGDKLFLNVCYVGFGTARLQLEPQIYAQQVLATFKHLQDKYGIVPDGWEIELEPDSVAAGQWTGPQLAQVMLVTGTLLKSSGFEARFIAPSTTSMGNALVYLDAIAQTPGALPFLYELSFHRYRDVSDANLQSLAERASQYGIHTAMLEHIGSGYQDLQRDLKLGNVAAWEQYALAYPTGDNGAQYYWIDPSDKANPVKIGQQTRFLRQYFKFIQRGAVRIQATGAGDRPYFDPVAFVNPDGTYVVVVASNYPGLPSASSFSVQGLPAGTYGIKYTTDSQFDVDLPDQTISTGQLLTTRMSGHGVLTIYGK